MMTLPCPDMAQIEIDVQNSGTEAVTWSGAETGLPLAVEKIALLLAAEASCAPSS